MYEVTDKNFEELYPKIEETLKNAVFFSVDSEFSGLKTDPLVKERLDFVKFSHFLNNFTYRRPTVFNNIENNVFYYYYYSFF